MLGWPGYRVYRHEINEKNKTLKLWVRRKRGNRVLRCPSCGRRVDDVHEVYERHVRDLPVSSSRADAAALKRFPGRLEFRTQNRAGPSWSQLVSSSEGDFIGLLPCTKLYKDADTE